MHAIFLYFGVCVSAVFGLRFTDLSLFMQAKISIQLIALDKATKESRDLSVCLCFYS